MRAALVLVMLFGLLGVLPGCRPPPPPEVPVVPDPQPPSTAPLFELHVPPRAPSTSGKAPALVLIHGVGSNEEDLLGLARAFDPRFDVHSLRAPIVRGPGSYAWFNVTFTADGPLHNAAEAEEARKIIVGFLRKLRADPAVDASRVYVLGFSQGAILGLSLAYTEPSLVAGVVAISGRTLQEVAASVKGKTLTGPRVLLMHGTEDNKLPYTHALASEQVLKATGLGYEFKSYPVGHGIDAAMRADIATWLSAELGAR